MIHATCPNSHPTSTPLSTPPSKILQPAVEMVVLRTQSEFGHAPPPQTQYSVITNCPGWAFMKGFRDGDKSQRARIVYTYPRIRPNFAVKEVTTIPLTCSIVLGI